MVALSGDSAVGEKRRDCGMRKRRRLLGPLVVEAEVALAGVGGGKDVEAEVGGSLIGNELLIALAGWDVGELAGLSKGYLEKFIPALAGLLNTGVRALRNSV